MTDQFLDFLPTPEFTENYSADDRYRDFRRIFIDDEAGTRVLHQILAWTKMFRVVRPSTPMDPLLLAYHEGERHIGAMILDTITREPVNKPTQSKRTKPNA